MEIPSNESRSQVTSGLIVSGLGLFGALVVFYFTESFEGKLTSSLALFISVVSFWLLYSSIKDSKTHSAIEISLSEHPYSFRAFQLMYSGLGFYCLFFSLYKSFWYGN